MDTAQRFSELSQAKRLKVGAIVVKDDRIISIGYNGTPAGWDNNCENIELMNYDNSSQISTEQISNQWPLEGKFWINGVETDTRYRLVTKPEVMHAERNALDKLAKGNESGDGASMFITHSPCLECAKSIFGSGIKTIYFKGSYRSQEGVEFLNKCGVEVIKVD